MTEPKIQPEEIEPNFIEIVSTELNSTELNIKAAPGGSVMNGGAIQSPNFVVGVSGWRIDSNGNVEFASGKFRGNITGATGTFSGSISAGSIIAVGGWTVNATSIYTGTEDHSGYTANVGDITLYSDGVDSSIHTYNWYIDSSGNFYSRSSNMTGASIGGTTRQYAIGDSGLFTFGDGSDGDVTTAGNVTLTADKYYDTLTISTGDTVNPAGYRIFCRTALIINGTGKIARNGVAGSNGGDAVIGTGGAAGAGGTALADGYLKGSGAGTNGGAGSISSNAGGTSTSGDDNSNCIGVNGAQGGMGGISGAGNAGGQRGAAGAATASNVKLIANWHLATLLDVGSTGATVKFDNSAGSGGGGGGGGDGGTGAGGGGGGGAGSAGGIIAIYAKTITIGASASITANGANGGNGGNGIEQGGDKCGGGGGGGAGGSGGNIILVYNVLTNSGSLTVTAGSGGSGGSRGAAYGSATNGDAATAGVAGNVRQFQIGL